MPRKKKMVRKFSGMRFRRYHSFYRLTNAEREKARLKKLGWLVRIIREDAHHTEWTYAFVIWRRRKK